MVLAPMIATMIAILEEQGASAALSCSATYSRRGEVKQSIAERTAQRLPVEVAANP
jgi:hypothetical protein